nr:hypothetical protein [Pseudobutyrivibrio sp.]
STKYSEYVRVKVRKYWVNEKAGVLEKNTSLDPALIKLDIDESVWFKNPNESTEEEDVYYYCNPLSKAVEGESNNALPFITGVTIDNQITTEVVLEGGTKNENGSITGNVTNKYIYDNASFYIEIEADAVQSHNAEAAIYGAWGVHATSTAEDDGTLTSIDGNATGR